MSVSRHFVSMLAVNANHAVERVTIEKPAESLQELIDLWFSLDEMVRVEDRYSALINHDAVGYVQYPKFEVLRTLLKKQTYIEYHFKAEVLPYVMNRIFTQFLDRYYVEVTPHEYWLREGVDTGAWEYWEAKDSVGEATNHFSKLYQQYLSNDCLLKAFCAFEKIAVGDPRLELSDGVSAQIERLMSLDWKHQTANAATT